MPTQKILIIGANGQIGSVLSDALRERYGNENVINSDINAEHQEEPFIQLNALDRKSMEQVIVDNQITQIYHLAAVLSAKGEADPLGTWSINMESLFNVLELGRKHRINRIFFPSSIGAFGPDSVKEHTPQKGYMAPTTVYGISKIAGELWSQYYWNRYGLDVRSVRFPGIIGYQSMPGGGTTDYAVDIYHKAVQGEHFTCFLREDSRLPMIYMEDAIRGTLQLMEAPPEAISIRTSYNLSGMSFTPAEIAAEIRKYIPDFSISYQPDERQQIADSWTDSLDDSQARNDWGWKPKYDLSDMTRDMLEHLAEKYQVALSF